jgi:CheY-like chemotaxis protein
MRRIERSSSIRDLSPFRRVLIVDDHFDSADTAAELLQEEGHETRVAYSPASAISIVASFHPQVALLDIGLPTMSGYELAELLRAHPSLAGCRFVALTGEAYEADRRESEAAGFYCHLAKPFGAQALFDAVAGSDASCAPVTGWSVG